ncbi:MAG: ABC transporter ATP-binding protein [Candidatus Pelethousia sp.]|nr:ABC transporter ATP-binding protein [Candidatus Pelethousia sp.]
MMIHVEGLCVNYGHIIALENVSLYIDEGEIVTLIGSNGAGKSSTLMAISGLVMKKGGTIKFKDTDITSMAPDNIVRLGICHVPEGRRVFPALTVYENLIAGTVGNPALKKPQISALLEEVYTLFPRMKERHTQRGGTLSGGEQQMLAIARGLMMDPKIIMLDEPSLGLAPIVVEEIFEMILKINSLGKTILLIEQNAAMALSIANRGYVMENGRIVMTGTGSALSTDPQVQKAYLGI